MMGRILIVDSRTEWILKLTDLLDGEFEIFTASSFIEASDLLDDLTSFFEVVITETCLDETDLGEKDGLKLIRKINENCKYTKTIILTAYPVIAEASRYIREKMVFDYLEKDPRDHFGKSVKFNGFEFCEIVRKAVEEAKYARNHIDIFVIMPFAKEFEPIYEYIQEVAQSMNKICKRADRPLRNGTSDGILSDIHYGIENAEVVVAELTNTKPNVIFEVGVCYALQKKVIMIAQNDEENKIPEMLSRHRIIYYSEKLGGEKALKSSLLARLDDEFSKSNIRENIFSEYNSSSCFVITSPTNDGHETYETIIRSVIERLDIDGIYLWDEPFWQMLDIGKGRSTLVEEKLRASTSVIADLSWDEPIAFYLAGLAYGLKKDYKFLYQRDLEPPFDIRDLGLLRHSNKSKVDRDTASDILYEWMQNVLRKNTPMLKLANDAKEETHMKNLQETKSITAILFLAAEPTDQVRLRLGQEFREIREELSKALQRERFKLNHRNCLYVPEILPEPC